jgi:SulP family sulfate permease
MAGIVIGVINVSLNLSFAALVFSGDLAVFLPNGIGLFMLGTALVGALMASFSYFRGTVVVLQDAGLILILLGVQNILQQVNDPAAPSTFVTVIAFIALGSISTGAFFLILGRFHLGNLIRFIPYPVIGGFLVAMGLGLVRGAFSIAADYKFSLDTLGDLLAAETPLRWLPAFFLGLILWANTRYKLHYLFLPAALVASMIGFWGLVFSLGYSADEILNGGWVLGPFPGQPTWQPLVLEDLTQIHWELIWRNSWHIAVAVLVNAMVLLLNISALEVQNQDDAEVKVNNELQVTGAANVLVGLTGGTTSFQSISLTLLSWTMKGHSRVVGWVVSLLFLLIFFLGFDLIVYFPRFILGGLLSFLALSIIINWLYDAWFKMPRQEYFFMLLIVGVVALVGYLEGIMVGMIGAAVLFAINYSRLDLVHKTDGTLYQSKLQRPPMFHQQLKEDGDKLQIYRLRGVLFFGSANALLERVVKYLEAPGVRLEFLVLDFQQVVSLDSSCVLTFTRLNQLLQKRGITLVISSLKPQLRDFFEHSQFDLKTRPYFAYFAELDEAVEWCENRLLEQMEDYERLSRSFSRNVAALFPELSQYRDLLPYMEHIEVPAGAYLAKQGERADTFYWIAYGRLHALVETEDYAQRVRIGTTGAIIGEVAFYTGQTRTASIMAAEASEVYALSRTGLAKLEAEQPLVALKLHRMMAALLSERLADTTNSLRSYL